MEEQQVQDVALVADGQLVLPFAGGEAAPSPVRKWLSRATKASWNSRSLWPVQGEQVQVVRVGDDLGVQVAVGWWQRGQEVVRCGAEAPAAVRGDVGE